MKNMLLEILEKPFLTQKVEDGQLTSTPDVDYVDIDLDNITPTGFYDDGSENAYFSISKRNKQTKLQNELIKNYREISGVAEVSSVIDEIVDEAIFSPGSDEILALDFDADVPQEIKDKFAEELKNITNQVRLDKNIYSMMSQFYVDGQLNIHCSYIDGEIEKGIYKIKVISPFGLNFNYTKNIWEYDDKTSFNDYYGAKVKKKNLIFSPEEIIRIDSGIYSDNVILSNLHTAIKPANMLSTLEDMLIPMRFTRSVSRRVFNIDVSKLNNKKAEEVMKKTQAKFKYKKFYDLSTGKISNQQHISSLTEDYWFPNRGGEKGTTVDTIDETGNLGELDDIIYFRKKLYTSLNFPTTRAPSEGGEGEFSYSNDSISRQELKFFNFISRLRNQFLELFYELLKRQIIAKGLATSLEWDELFPSIKIKFVSENAFFEKMEREQLSEQISQYGDIEELIGKYFSYGFVFKKIFKMSDEEIKDMAEEIENEKKDPVYSRFYGGDEDNDW